MEGTQERTATVRALFKRFLAERWFGGPDFDSWIGEHAEYAAELRVLRDEWLQGLGDPESPGLPEPGERVGRRAGSFAPGEVVGGFRLKRRLGSGASGDVWEAEELALENRRVALKLLRPDLVLDPRALERFRREAVAGARLSHPGIVTVYSVGRAHGQPYIAMELVEGGATLASLLAEQRERGGPDAAYVRSVCTLLFQAAEALASAHEIGMVHRDVKPQNILVASGDRAKVADFGLAHLAGENVLSQTGDVMGTFCYMSPSQLRGQVKQLDGRADVFSLGATLYELLTMRRAFPGSSPQEVMHRVLFEDPPLARTVNARVPAQLELLCSKALEKDAADRLPSMRVFAEELRRFLAGEPSLLRPTTLAARAVKWTRRHRAASTSAAVLLVAGLGFLWLGSVKARESREARLEALHAKALYAIEIGDLEEAGRWIAEADALDPRDPTGHLILATGFARGNRRDETLAELAEARARGFRDDPARLESALEHAGYALYVQSLNDLNRYPEVAHHIERALELDPKLYALEFARFQVCTGLGDREGAASALERLQSRVRSSEPLHDLLGALVLENRGELRAALEALDQLAARADVSPEALRAVRWNRHAGRIAFGVGDLQRAEDLLRLAVAEVPADCTSREGLAAVYLERLRAHPGSSELRQRALARAEEALACSPSLEVPYLVQALTAEIAIDRELESSEPGGDPRRSAHWQVAEEALARVQALHPGGSAKARMLESHLRFLEALPLYYGGDKAGAAELYEQALELDPDNLRALALLGQCQHALREYSLALATLDRGLARWDAGDRGAAPDARWLGALLAWSLGAAAELDDGEAFAQARDRLERELAAQTPFLPEDLFTAAEFLAGAPEGLRDCDLALGLVDEHGLRTRFLRTRQDAAARAGLAKIDAACPP